MFTRRTSVESIRRVMTAGFTLQDIAEPLVSFDASMSAPAALEFLTRHDYDCAGVRRDGFVVGMICREDLGAGACGDFMQAMPPGTIHAESASLADVVKGLVDQPRLFVELLGTVGGIVTREDLAKPPVRMWLFGMISIIEMRLVKLITNRFPDNSWCSHLSRGRLEKAEHLFTERTRRNREVRLIDCLQMSDKGRIIVRDDRLRATMRFPSKRKAEDLMKKLEGLRNNLAHSQDIVSSDWEVIVILSENLDRVIEGPPSEPDLLEERT